MNDDTPTESVPGERDHSTITRTLSIQSRVSNVLAIGLMSVLGLGSLAWYYAQTLMRQGHGAANAAAANRRTQSDVPLPSLGRIDPPTTAPWFDPLSPPAELPREPPPALPLVEAAPQPGSPVANPTPPPKTPAELAVERQLTGAVFSPNPAASGGEAAGRSLLPEVAEEGTRAMADTSAIHRETDLAALLRPSVAKAVRAQVLPTQRLLLPKGAFIDCTLETAIDSTLPGMTTCVMATDAFGVDGDVVLLERGTKLVGETRGQLSQGAARVFVLWTEARTPAGVIVPLDSPGTDELGRSGLPGDLNRHFWERFGAAMLVSVLDGAVQTAAESARGGGNVIVNPSASQDVVTEILKGTINIPPTVVKHHGDRIQVLVARDLDFRSVYELRSAGGR